MMSCIMVCRRLTIYLFLPMHIKLDDVMLRNVHSYLSTLVLWVFVSGPNASDPTNRLNKKASGLPFDG